MRIITGNEAVVVEVKPEPRNSAGELDTMLGSGLGDVIKVLATPVAKILGKQDCSTCQTRRIIANGFERLRQQHGSLRALLIILDLWSKAKADPDSALDGLREMLGL